MAGGVEGRTHFDGAGVTVIVACLSSRLSAFPGGSGCASDARVCGDGQGRVGSVFTRSAGRGWGSWTKKVAPFPIELSILTVPPWLVTIP